MAMKTMSILKSFISIPITTPTHMHQIQVDTMEGLVIDNQTIITNILPITQIITLELITSLKIMDNTMCLKEEVWEHIQPMLPPHLMSTRIHKMK